MGIRLILESIRRRAKSRAAAVAALAFGAGAASGLVLLLIGVGDRISEELRRLDANIEIVPKSGRLLQKDLPLLRSEINRWGNQIRFLIPELRVERAGYVLVGRDPDPRWKVEGTPGVLAGISLGLAPGATIQAGRPLTVTGVVSTGGDEDGEILLPLAVAQDLAGTPGELSRVLVSAVVTAETDEFGRFNRKEKRFTDAQIEKMMCTPFPSNVARECGNALDADARVLREIADHEGALLRRIDGVVGILAGAAILAACLSVLATMTASVVDRRKEIGLLKALGATNGAVAALFIGEALLLALPGSLVGYLIGLAAAKSMSVALFGSTVPGSAVVSLVTLATAMIITALGVAWPLRRAVALEPRTVLHEA
ncbi:MAG TPA: ABC transporter permease [Planctomycetota bacterium]|nr:ABC transporter permease [Planctomycetota bacterium]